MSRPFSYNDKNFTVMGNLLIIHVAFNGELAMNDVICEIPPEIVKRIKYKGFAGTYYKNPYSPIVNIGLFVQRKGLSVSRAGNYTDGEFFAIINLEDI